MNTKCNYKKNYTNEISFFRYCGDLSTPPETLHNPLGISEDIVRTSQKCGEIGRNVYPLAVNTASHKVTECMYPKVRLNTHGPMLQKQHSKVNQMLETPVKLTVLDTSKNLSDGDNQQERLLLTATESSETNTLTVSNEMMIESVLTGNSKSQSEMVDRSGVNQSQKVTARCGMIGINFRVPIQKSSYMREQLVKSSVLDKSKNLKNRVNPQERMQMPKALPKPTREWLDYEYTTNKRSSYDIAKEKECDPTVVQRWLRQYGIRVLKPFERLGLPSQLNQEQEQIVLGSLLGDGYIPKRYAFFGKDLHRKSLGYINWMKNKLEPWGRAVRFNSSRRIFNGRTVISPMVRYETHEHPIFEDLRQKFYPNDVKIVTEDILESLDILGFAIWFMDDGSGNKRAASLHTENFTLDENEMILSFIKSKFGITGSIVKRDSRMTEGRKNYNLNLNKEFMNIVKSYVEKIPCMRYKVKNAKSSTTNTLDASKEVKIESELCRDAERLAEMTNPLTL